MIRAQTQRCIVAVLSILNLPLLFVGIGEVAVCVWEVGLEIDGSTVCVNCQVNEALFIVDARQVSVHHSIVGREIKCTQVSSDSSEIIEEKETIKY